MPNANMLGAQARAILAIRKVYGKDHLRLLRWCKCREEFSERRSTALLNIKIREAKANVLSPRQNESSG
jgi:hypothetical protein